MFLKVRLRGSGTMLVNTDNIVSIDCERQRVHTVDGKSHTLCAESYDALLCVVGSERWNDEARTI